MTTATLGGGRRESARDGDGGTAADCTVRSTNRESRFQVAMCHSVTRKYQPILDCAPDGSHCLPTLARPYLHIASHVRDRSYVIIAF